MVKLEFTKIEKLSEEIDDQITEDTSVLVEIICMLKNKR
jgi:hypothetical protein